MNCKKECGSLISVIVPVYNVEKHLRRCIDSIISQSYDNLEIILIDDGSPDNCGRICDEYASADNRIKVIHKQNGGLSDARNCGIGISSGQYITFIDSDDYVAGDYIQHLYDLLIKNSADISCCNRIETLDDSAEFDYGDATAREQTLSGKECCHALFGDLYLTLVTAWGKLYKKEVVQKYLFPVGRKHEDEATTCKYYYDAQHVAISSARLYAYYQNPAGIMNSIGKGINFDAIWALEHRARFFENNGEYRIAHLSWNAYFQYCVEDSLKNNGRCDKYLVGFDCDKNLSRRLIFESHLFNTSHLLFKLYWKLKEKLRNIKKCIIHRK